MKKRKVIACYFASVFSGLTRRKSSPRRLKGLLNASIRCFTFTSGSWEFANTSQDYQCSLWDSIWEKWKSFWFLKRKNIIDFTHLHTGGRLSLTPGLKILENFIKGILHEQLMKEPARIHEKQMLNLNQQFQTSGHYCATGLTPWRKEFRLQFSFQSPLILRTKNQCESNLYNTKHSEVLY